MDYLQLFADEFRGHALWLLRSVLDPDVHAWIWWVAGISLGVWLLELLLPWRRDQRVLRRDFWLDALHVVFNSFVFPALGFAAGVKVLGVVARDLLAAVGAETTSFVDVSTWPVWAQWLTLLVARDFVHWNVHRLLHRVPWLWEFHRVHHSAREMGFASHLRFHWMETVLYTTLEAAPLSLIGFGVSDFLVVHVFALTMGHLNHANLGWTYGPLRYVLNSPAMHVWHHARYLPADRTRGVNFGLTLSLWDWLFGTAWWPRSGRDEELGFEAVEEFPDTFAGQLLHPWLPRTSRALAAARGSVPPASSSASSSRDRRGPP